MRPENKHNTHYGKRRPLAVLLLLLLLALVGACNNGSPTDPVDGDGDGNGDGDPPVVTDIVFSGPGAALLPSTDFPVDASFEDEIGNLTWVDQNASRAADDVKILVFRNPVDPEGATSVTLLYESATQPGGWNTFAIGSLAGVSIVNDQVTFTDVVVSDNIYHQGDVTINGTLDLPTTVLTPPDAPVSVTVTSQDGNLEVSWPAVTGADLYTVYVARESGINPTNWPGLSGGERHESAVSPFTFPDGLTNGLIHYVIVTATNAAGEGDPSATESGTPIGAAPDLGSLSLSGDGAALLPATEFAPDTALPGDMSTSDGSFLWLDHAGTQGQMQVWLNTGEQVVHVRFISGNKVWQKTSWTGLSDATFADNVVTLSGRSLDEEGGGTTLILDGSVNAVLTVGTLPSGTMTFSGEGAAVLPSTTFTPTGIDFAGGHLVLTDSNGVTLEVKLNGFLYEGLYRITVAQGTSFFIKQTGNDPIEGTAATGIDFSCTDVILSPVWGSGDLILNGTLGF